MVEQTLVIGSTGLVGRHVVGYLADRRHTVVGMRRWNSESEVLETLGVPDVVADLADLERLAHAVSGVNHIIYCAAPDTSLEPRRYQRCAVEWIRNVLQMARDKDVDRVVVTSTASTIGRPESANEVADRHPDGRDAYLPGSAGDHFVEAAYAVEQEVFRQAADGQDVVILNPTVIVGEGARLPSAHGAGGVDADAPVNWVAAERVARAHEAALNHGKRGGRYVVGGTNGTLGELYDVVERHPAVEVTGSGLFGNDVTYRNRHLLTSGQRVDTSRSERILGLG